MPQKAVKEVYFCAMSRLDPNRRIQFLLRHPAAPRVAWLAFWDFRKRTTINLQRVQLLRGCPACRGLAFSLQGMQHSEAAYLPAFRGSRIRHHLCRSE